MPADVFRCRSFSKTKRITGLLRMVQAGVIVTDYSTAAVEMLKDNASPKAGALYAALDIALCRPDRTIGGSIRQRPRRLNWPNTFQVDGPINFRPPAR